MPCSFVNSVTDKLTGTVSLGAAVLSAVLIASQMPSDFDVVSVVRKIIIDAQNV